MLNHVTIDSQYALIGENAHLFPKYFGIDSISLMLGKNGSGKTRLLHSLAEILTSGAPLREQGHWLWRDSHGSDLVSDTQTPPPNLGVVYFTPLPYHRSINPHRKLVNASKLKSNELKKSMLYNFTNIANSLGISTQLTASLTYHPKIFKRLIVPLLLEMQRDLVILEPSIDAEFRRYIKIRSKGTSKEEN